MYIYIYIYIYIYNKVSGKYLFKKKVACDRGGNKCHNNPDFIGFVTKKKQEVRLLRGSWGVSCFVICWFTR